ncbi:MAG: iron-sulfur cluster assembly scaffold protein [Alphaproteobacteria bacterium]|nr:iron-sulfur cluster assembly scaffold protein [Alphaproteobacteria bacterium]
MSDALYNDQILALAAGLEKKDRLDAPDATASVTSPLCGSRVKVDLVLRDGVIADYGQEVRACALGQSSAALMKRLAVGHSLSQIAAAREAVRAMLKDGGAPPTGDWSDYGLLQPARDHRSRHPAILLPFDAIAKAAVEAEDDAQEQATA